MIKIVSSIALVILIIAAIFAANLLYNTETFDDPNPAGTNMVYSDRYDIVGNTLIGPMPNVTLDQCFNACLTNQNCIGVLTTPVNTDSTGAAIMEDRVNCWAKGRNSGIDTYQTLMETPFCRNGMGQNVCNSYVKKSFDQLIST